MRLAARPLVIPSMGRQALRPAKLRVWTRGAEIGTLPSARLLLLACCLWASPAAGQGVFSATGRLDRERQSHTATLLPSGKVLLAGGATQVAYLASAELYDAGNGTSTATGSLIGARCDHTATLLPSGKVLVTGGRTLSTYLASAELYDPESGTWTATGPLASARSGHTATLLPTGRVLVAGGYNGSSPLAVAELYDPVSGAWTATGSLSGARSGHTATVLPSGRVLVAGGSGGAGGLASAELYDPLVGVWAATGALLGTRSSHTATLLPGGRVVVAGGRASALGAYLASAELYDSVTGTWTASGSLSGARSNHTATLLPSGKVLVVGGHGGGTTILASAEVFDPSSGGGTWTVAGSLLGTRSIHTATLLAGGKVLVAGGVGLGGDLASAELYDAAVGTWAATGSLGVPRSGHTATRLPNGKVLVAGYWNLATAELYDPATGTWTATGSLAGSRSGHTATLLHDGKVLVAGGRRGVSGRLASAELYDPATGTWTVTGSLATAHYYHTATLLPDGRVLVAGGRGAQGEPIAGAEVYDPASGTWTATGSLGAAREFSTATLLPGGKVLVAGGYNFGASLFSAELYDPGTGAWTPTTGLAVGRSSCTATLLPGGKVLVAGGSGGGGFVATAEIYDPVIGTWTATGSLAAARDDHTATLLPSGRVLVVGGSAPLASAELYDPATGTWTATGPLAVARGGHKAALLSAGKVLIAGGYSGGGALASAALYEEDPLSQARRPAILAGPQTIVFGATVSVSGHFRGDSEASGGKTSNSAVNYPIVEMQSAEDGRWLSLRADGRSNFWDDPMTLTLSDLPSELNPGSYLLTVAVAGVRSAGWPVRLDCSVAITTSPPSLTVPLGLPATFTVRTQGARRHQWQSNFAGGWQDIPGAAGPSYVIPQVQAAHSGSKYRVVVTGACPSPVATSTEATLTVADSTPPMASVVSPSGGEYLLLSEADKPANAQVVSWTMSDDVRICRADVSLEYSDDGGVTYRTASPGGGLPATFGPGGSCPYPGVTTANLAYVVPTSFPSGRAGSLYRVRLSVQDQVEHLTTVTSARPFYFVRANPDSVKTLILKNPSRMEAVLGEGLSVGEKAALAARILAFDVKLEELANHPRVLGFVVDLGARTTLGSLYVEWDASPGDSSKANRVLFGCHGGGCGAERDGVHDVVRELLRAYTGVKHVVVVGDDRVIPFARMVDRTVLLGEDTYANGSGVTAVGTTVGRALAAKKVLTDDVLAMRDEVRAEDLEGQLFVPELAVGRLVETPEEMTATIATYIAQDGVLDLSALDPATGHKVVVTGYDFLSDAARTVRSGWKGALGVSTGDSSLAPVDGALIGGSWGLGSVSAQKAALRTHLGGNGAERYGVTALLGHATHYEEGVPGSGTDPHVVQGLPAVDIAGADQCGTPSAPGLELSGGVVVAVGCHGGLTVPGSCATDGEHSLDLPQAFLGRGVLGYVANTGYGWGLKHGIGYGERLLQIVSEELGGGGTVEVGEAVRRTKLRYYLETPRFDAYDEKSLMQWTLFGLPMYAVKTGIEAGAGASQGAGLFRSEASSVPDGEETQRLGGVVVSRSGVREEVSVSASLPAYLTQVNLHFDLGAEGVYVKRDAEGNDVSGSVGCPATLPDGVTGNEGCYYTLNGLVERASGAGDLPVQPYLVYDSRLSGTSQHGVLWLGGEYEEEAGWRPIVGELVSNGGNGSDHGPLPRTATIKPIAPRVTVGVDPAECRASDLEVNSLLVAAGEAVKPEASEPLYTIERRFRTIDVEALYFNDTSRSLNNCDREGPVLGTGPYHAVSGSVVSFAVGASDASGVWRVLVVWNDNTRDAQGRGRWRPLELVPDGSTGVWRGTLNVAGSSRITYVVEAMDARGNVRWLEWTSADLPSSGVPLGIPAPTDVAVTPAAAPTITDFTPRSGPAGAMVMVTGAGFAGATAVSFAGVTTSFSVASATLLTALAPLVAVAGPIAVTTPFGSATSTQVFTPTSPIVADVAVGKTGPLSVAPGAPLSWTITLSNDGPDAVSGVGLTDSPPADVTGLVWTCSASAGSACTSAGVGALLDTASLAVGGRLTYTLTGTVSPSTAVSSLVNTATLTLPAGVSDSDTTDHSASWTTEVSSGDTFFTLAPCRLVDTRAADAPILTGGQDRTFALAGGCGVPTTARSLALIVTVTGPTAAGNVRLWPAGTPVPTTSTINFGPGQTRANNAILQLGTSGALNARLSPTGQTHLVLDVSGYFQ